MTHATAAHLKPSPADARPSRWRTRAVMALKEAACWLFLNGGYVAIRDAVLSLLGRSRAVIVFYHRIGGLGVLDTPAEQFRNQMRYLSSRYRCMGLADLCHALREGRAMRRRTVVITFDDGYRDNRTNAVPVLQEFGVPATFFVATGFIGTDRSFPHDCRAVAGDVGHARHANLSWDDLRSMQAAGFEIGSHTVEHANLGRTSTDVARAELAGSMDALDRELGPRPRAFAFPWGKPGDVSDAARDIARSLGCYAACSGYGGAVRRGADPMRLPRCDVGNGRLSMLAFRARIAGLDPDYLRYRRAARRMARGMPDEVTR